MSARSAVLTGAAAALVLAAVLPATGVAADASARTFARPEQAVQALVEVVKAGDLAGVVALFGPGGQELLDTSDPATGRRNREVFLAAIAEGYQLEETAPDRKQLILGDEAWPFPVPLVRGPSGWSFDAAAGREEILNRRIGRNELATIRILHEYVAAQRGYAATGHDGQRAGLYARRFGSDWGKQNGLYWPARHGEPRSPLGVLVAKASEEGYHRTSAGEGPTPLYGYYFRILERQGPSARGGAAGYVSGGVMSGGFALVAWPVHYGASGIMTFLVNQDDVAYENDLGPGTAEALGKVDSYDPDATWRPVAAVER
jgi:hypothetical protein